MKTTAPDFDGPWTQKNGNNNNPATDYGSAAVATACQSPLPIYSAASRQGADAGLERREKNVFENEDEDEERTLGAPSITAPALSQSKKWCLLALFCLGVFMDVLGVCVFYILLTPVTRDLDIVFEQQTWVVTSFGVTFAAFLLFWGRVADLYSPKIVFCFGFLAFGILNLIVSFLTDKYSFLIFRGLAGVSAAAIIPASYRLITSTFAAHELPRAFTVYSLSGSIAGASGVMFGGIVMLIPNGGQMSGWRWFFRIVAAIVIPTSIWSFWYIPKPRGLVPKEKGKWKRLDVPGTLLILAGILFFILSLTMGASFSWSDARFIAPLIVSLFLIPAFFFWEARIPANDALIPPVTWKAKNFTMWIILSMFGYAWWTCNQIPIIEVWINERGDEPIVAASRLLPSGGFSIMSSFILIAFPKFTVNPRLGFTVGQLGGMVGYALFVVSDGRTGADYFKYYFTGLAIGSFCNNLAVTCIMVGAMTAAPPEQAGVAGALLQAAIQAGNVVALTIQAGLLTIHPGGVADFRNVAASFYFMIGWGGACLVAFWVFFRQPPKRDSPVVVAH